MILYILATTNQIFQNLLEDIQAEMSKIDQPLYRNLCGYLKYKGRKYYCQLFDKSFQLFKSIWRTKPRYRFQINETCKLSSTNVSDSVFVLSNNSVYKNSFDAGSKSNKDWWIKIIEKAKSKQINWVSF